MPGRLEAKSESVPLLRTHKYRKCKGYGSLWSAILAGSDTEPTKVKVENKKRDKGDVGVKLKKPTKEAKGSQSIG
jgi:hypothetical protein